MGQIHRRERFTFGAAPIAPLAAARVFWVTRAAVLFLALLAGCGKSSLTSPTDLPAAKLTPSGALALHPHTYGQVLPWKRDGDPDGAHANSEWRCER